MTKHMMILLCTTNLFMIFYSIIYKYKLRRYKRIIFIILNILINIYILYYILKNTGIF